MFWSRFREVTEEKDSGSAPEEWGGQPHCGFFNLAVRVGAAWFAMPSPRSFCGAIHIDGTVKLERFAVEPTGPGGAPLVALYVSAKQDYKWDGEGNQSVTFIGVGPSGKPSSIGPIVLSRFETGETAPKQEAARRRATTPRTHGASATERC